jgi:hypothetical protein
VTRSTRWLVQCVMLGSLSLSLWWFPVSRVIAQESLAIRSGLSRIDDVDLKRHVTTLAGDSLEGREAGARGGKAAAAYLRSELKRLREMYPVPREKTQEFGREFQNLLVLLPGSDPRLKLEVIVVGAHYDHVGYGNSTNSQGPIGHIHNGADDNASGTSALLELIEAFTSLEKPPARSILFAFWDAEEAGLLGSKHWVAHPTIPLRELRFVLNLDMLGRLREGRVVTVGWRSAPGLRPMLASHNLGNVLSLAYQPKVIADSDHFPFYSSGIPAIHLDTDKHDDYHRPTDDADKVNWIGLRQLTEFAYRVVFDAAHRPDFPKFRREATTEPAPAWLTPRAAVAAPIRLGVTWDSELAGKDIVEVAQVSADSPAARAGLQPRDRIVRLGSWENGTMDDLKTVIQLAKNPVLIRVERPGSESPIDVSAEFRGSPVRLGAGWMDDAALPNCAVITHVVAESPAARAGIAAGDVILEMGGRPLSSSDEMRDRVMSEPGPLRFRVERQGRIRDVTVDLHEDGTRRTAP